MVKNVKLFKVDVEKSEMKSSKTITIKDVEGNTLIVLGVFTDGTVFIRKAKDVYVRTDKIETNVIEPKQGLTEEYLHVILKTQGY